jgi:hypothetical protein
VLEKDKEELEQRYHQLASAHGEQARSEMEAARMASDAEKQNLLTEHVKKVALKEREWRKRVEQLSEEKTALEHRVSVEVADKEKELSAIIARLGYEKLDLESRHKEDLLEADKQARTRVAALQDEVHQLEKLDYKALVLKADEQLLQIKRLVAEAKDAAQKHEDDRARLIRVGEMELRAANERLEDHKVSARDQHLAELTRKEGEWKREVARLEGDRQSADEEHERVPTHV